MATAAAAAPLRCCHRLSSGKSCVCTSSVLPPRDFNAAVEAHRVQIHWDPLLELDAPTRPPSALEEPRIARDALILLLASKGREDKHSLLFRYRRSLALFLAELRRASM